MEKIFYRVVYHRFQQRTTHLRTLAAAIAHHTSTSLTLKW